MIVSPLCMFGLVEDVCINGETLANQLQTQLDINLKGLVIGHYSGAVVSTGVSQSK